ncbi:MULTISPECIES: DUF3566 domain-containing protein [Rathayibacter]|jgi:hypothetical protein|uniref:DUF3566 domain-containing protein n=2 Tax=Rathayibacter festucae TaxID=110937 RepID=A0A3T0T4A8_9MICO|nr:MULTISPECIES: DUF3566 domain-containing protein [Rathayibacter]AZZ53436.1 hypothetical protein C1I64_16265 [Rathayibacter festucae DSM 15932]MCJ1673591.1 DUF3566 domain-containing protein [Rathayibacter sp. VKM Ac-2929]MCJ1683380.1 DUF3566 domain-containing protein [Rathayibacter sp. VKM Ac-2928]MCJ1688298.1 DUF3566 domain-containing protein [Rathayibacter sp. VKM Ac-2927]MCJ1698284.1 DUF3566 domain-containing protein [Rathayibacter festucae]
MSSTVAEKLAKKSAKSPAAKQVRLKLVYVDFWSAVKLSFLLGLTLAIITIVVVYLVYTVLAQTGVFDEVNGLVQDIAGAEAFDLNTIISLPQIMGFAVVVAVLNTIVTTALGAIVALLYNLSVKITGGLLVGFTNQ